MPGREAGAARTDNTGGRQELRLALTGMGDMERLMSRIVYGTAGARDLVNLRAALEHLPEIKRCLVPFRTGALGKLDEQLETLEDISGRIAAVLVDEPPFSVREGEMIRGDACAEGELQWVQKSEVQTLPIWEGDKLFFRLLEEEHPYFSLKLVYDGDTLKQAVLDGKRIV